MTKGTRTVRVAAIQAGSKNGAPQDNLDNCARLVADAAEKGAELVLCPEFLAAGYLYEESIWAAGETRGGLTETWLADLASQHRFTIGATYLEAEGEHFYNTFALFNAEGLVGRVRKRSLPFFEGWFFTPCEKKKLLKTEFGEVAVGICNDTQTAGFMRDVISGEPDLILMPHSAPSPVFPMFHGVARRIYDHQLSQSAKRYAKAFGIPVVMANKASSDVVESTLPIRTLPLGPFRVEPPTSILSIKWTFEGHSSIVDAEGKVLAQKKGAEAVLVEDIVLDPGRKRQKAKPRGYWSFAPPLFSKATGAFLNTLEKLGMQGYRDNPRRRQAALDLQSDGDTEVVLS